MAIVRNKVTDKGFFTDKIGDGYNELEINGVQQTMPPMVRTTSGSVAARAAVSITDPFTMVPMNCTATLPQITNANVGRMYVIALTASDATLAPSNTIGRSLLSSSNQQLINGSGVSRVLSGSCNLVWCFAAKTPANTFTWIAASGSAA